MKITEMAISNFRQFYGEQTLRFATDRDRNVTVFHGFNGAGKTALLNAFIWCLYGKTTPDLESPQRLLNEKALADACDGEALEVRVHIVFLARDVRYVVERRRSCVKKGLQETLDQDPELRVLKTDSKGCLSPLDSDEASMQMRINQLLPEELHPFFFFNGERVERLASPKAYDQVETGIKTLLDVEVFERAAHHLSGSVSRALSKDLKAFGDQDTRDFVEEEASLEDELTSAEARLTQIQANISANAETLEAVERRQNEVAALKALTRERDQLRAQRAQLEDQLAQRQLDIASALSKNGYLAFAAPLFNTTTDLIDEARKRGELPAKIKPQFVNDLLHGRQCICGTALPDGSPERGRLLQWREETGLAELEETIAYTSTSMTALQNRQEDYFDAVDRTQSARDQLTSDRDRINERLSAIAAELESKKYGEEAAELGEQKAALESERFKLTLQEQRAQEKILALVENIQEVRRKIKQQELHDEKARLVQRQKVTVENVAEALRQITEIQKDDVRASLDAHISCIWKDAAIKDYEASVSEDYRLTLTKKIQGRPQRVHGASTGEKQVLALSFVASLVKKAEENLADATARKNIKDRPDRALGVEMGGLYPLVMDSPFGSLEDDYRSKVAEWVPTLAHQVIMMVSRTQWRHEVERALRSRIGRRYILELHTSKEGAARKIEIDGREHDYVVEEYDPCEHTIIRAVEDPS